MENKFDKETIEKCLYDIFFLERLPQPGISYTYKDGQWSWSNETKTKLYDLMRESEKYYTPNIEELHIGYECEIKFPMMSNWETTKLKGSMIEELGIYSKEGISSSIRTPYLTKEQIEAEGWVYKNTYDTIIKFYKELEEESIHIEYNTKDYSLYILRASEGYHINNQIFDGECKSINEFRTILKLLNIKK